MVSPLDAPLRTVASVVLGIFGQTATLKRVVPDTYDALDPDASGGPTTTEVTVKISPPEAIVSEIDLDSTTRQFANVKNAELKVLVSAKELELTAIPIPNPETDKLVLNPGASNEEELEIVESIKIDSGELPAVYELFCKR